MFLPLFSIVLMLHCAQMISIAGVVKHTVQMFDFAATDFSFELKMGIFLCSESYSTLVRIVLAFYNRTISLPYTHKKSFKCSSRNVAFDCLSLPQVFHRECQTATNESLLVPRPVYY